MNAFQLAITNFVEGYREGVGEIVDLSKVFQGMTGKEPPLNHQPRGLDSDSQSGLKGSSSTSPAALHQRASSPVSDLDIVEPSRAPQSPDDEQSASASFASEQPQSLEAADTPDIRASTLDEEWAGRSDKQRRADSSSREALLSAATDNSTLLYPTGQRTASTSQPDGDKASQVRDRPSNQESSSSRREGRVRKCC